MTPPTESAQFVTVQVVASVGCESGLYYPVVTISIAGHEHERLRYMLECDTEDEAMGVAEEIARVERWRIRRSIDKELARMRVET